MNAFWIRTESALRSLQWFHPPWPCIYDRASIARVLQTSKRAVARLAHIRDVLEGPSVPMPPCLI